MKNQITITKKQAQQFNSMKATLNRIAKEYQTPTQLQRQSQSDYGLEYSEAMEMAYENIQSEAKFAVRGVKSLKLENS